MHLERCQPNDSKPNNHPRSKHTIHHPRLTPCKGACHVFKCTRVESCKHGMQTIKTFVLPMQTTGLRKPCVLVAVVGEFASPEFATHVDFNNAPRFRDSVFPTCHFDEHRKQELFKKICPPIAQPTVGQTVTFGHTADP